MANHSRWDEVKAKRPAAVRRHPRRRRAGAADVLRAQLAEERRRHVPADAPGHARRARVSSLGLVSGKLERRAARSRLLHGCCSRS